MYTYVDGNNNTYRLDSDDILSYDPITPSESSSGSYSGGQPISIRLDSEPANRLRKTLDKAISMEGGASTMRNKGSGLLIRAEPKGRAILPRNSAINAEIIDSLRALIESNR